MPLVLRAIIRVDHGPSREYRCQKELLGYFVFLLCSLSMVIGAVCWWWYFHRYFISFPISVASLLLLSYRCLSLAS